jgi:hypothetical protein
VPAAVAEQAMVAFRHSLLKVTCNGDGDVAPSLDADECARFRPGMHSQREKQCSAEQTAKRSPRASTLVFVLVLVSACCVGHPLL